MNQLWIHALTSTPHHVAYQAPKVFRKKRMETNCKNEFKKIFHERVHNSIQMRSHDSDIREWPQKQTDLMEFNWAKKQKKVSSETGAKPLCPLSSTTPNILNLD